MPSLMNERRSPLDERGFGSHAPPPPASNGAGRAKFHDKPIKMRQVGELVLDESLRGVPIGFVRRTLQSKVR